MERGEIFFLLNYHNFTSLEHCQDISQNISPGVSFLSLNLSLLKLLREKLAISFTLCWDREREVFLLGGSEKLVFERFFESIWGHRPDPVS